MKEILIGICLLAFGFLKKKKKKKKNKKESANQVQDWGFTSVKYNTFALSRPQRCLRIFNLSK